MGNKHRRISKFDIHRKMKPFFQKLDPFQQIIYGTLRKFKGLPFSALDVLRVEVLWESATLHDVESMVLDMPDGQNIINELVEDARAAGMLRDWAHGPVAPYIPPALAQAAGLLGPPSPPSPSSPCIAE